MDENQLITGASSSNALYIWDIVNNTVNEPKAYFYNHQYIGYSVGIKGNFAIAGENTDNNCKIFQLDGTPQCGGCPPWEAYSNTADPSITSLGYGRTAAVSESHYMISAMGEDNLNGKVIFIPTGMTPPPVNVQATDGTQPGQVSITWQEPSDLSNISSYKVFRDGVFLTSVSSVGPPGNTLSHTDLPSSGLIPGRHYAYQVEATYGTSASKPVGDEGWMPEDGEISGTLTTLPRRSAGRRCYCHSYGICRRRLFGI